ncbi:phosphate/phosphite/phosphonate ABC transporter substrate-binding protein [Halomonas sp. ZH2S]|uniref:Phosphate/phosphite/phosphonate ABC transporter substrate-binding protein n=1 Tax=Vreelandella zhuhanensis TaxID=2684210 RepID=A0A7X3H230_9GAMM|nr:phosphate/phosphite/phosphonate ABC transporter substrate-binding protein [Halomonas zhuhanensis]MWJ28941.1 phosphate/phosphite/phosphonate ABC transporter substrate-binding protein [Halomonas zhuhanensis]
MSFDTLSQTLPRTLLGTAIAATLAFSALPASAADLSSRFIDSDGDMVADTPADETQWTDPDTLVFAYTPVEDPAVYAEVWAGFLEHMEAVTGKRVQFFPVQSNAAQLEAMRAGRLHIAGFNTGSVPVAVNCAGFVPFSMMAAEDGSFGYEMEIISYPGSGIQSVEDLAGRNLAFTSPTSNSGFRAPSALLRSQYDLEADEDFETAFSGSHDNSILGVVNEDYDAAAIANSVAARMLARDVIKEGDYEVIYTSDTFPTTAYGHVHNLHPELTEKVHDAFSSFDWEGSALKAEFANSGEAQFVPITYQRNWEVIRTIAEANGVTYDCE